MSYDREPVADKVAIVTGAASGIGRAVADHLERDGATVVRADIAGGAHMRYLDVTRREAWQSFAEAVAAEFGRIDILVNAAGILGEGTLWSTTLAEWRRIFATNVEGTFWGCQAVLPHMGTGSAIVNMASASGHLSDPGLLAYTTSKCAVRNLTREVAMDCARRGRAIRCNSVSPGVVNTEMVRNFFADAPEGTREAWLKTQPVEREIDPGEVANLVAFLASEEAAFVTGADLPIDCGATA